MAIRFHPNPKTILLCNYDLGGFRPPEMVKLRPAVVISPRLSHRGDLCTVVPFSTSAPKRDLPYVVRVNFATPLPAPFNSQVVWAKCDMLATVALSRLDLFRTARDHTGKRKYLAPMLPEDDFEAVRQGVMHALGMLK